VLAPISTLSSSGLRPIFEFHLSSGESPRALSDCGNRRRRAAVSDSERRFFLRKLIRIRLRSSRSSGHSAGHWFRFGSESWTGLRKRSFCGGDARRSTGRCTSHRRIARGTMFHITLKTRHGGSGLFQAAGLISVKAARDAISCHVASGHPNTRWVRVQFKDRFFIATICGDIERQVP